MRVGTAPFRDASPVGRVRTARAPVRAMTMAEMLVSLALLLVALGVIATLFIRAAQDLRFQEESDESLRALQDACHSVSDDVAQGIYGTARPSGLAETRLTLQRVREADPLAATASTPSPLAVESVVFRLDAPSRTLVRQARGVTAVVARNIEDFQAHATSDDAVEFTITAHAGNRPAIRLTQVVQMRVVLLPNAVLQVGP